MIRKVLKDMASEKSVECLGRGKRAKWRRIGLSVMVIGSIIGKLAVQRVLISTVRLPLQEAQGRKLRRAFLLSLHNLSFLVTLH